MERKFLTVVIILLLFGTSTIPAIANNRVDLEDEKESACMGFIYLEKTENTGKIYGYTHCSHGVWTWDPIPHAIVRIGLKITRSDSNGYYEITGLPLNRTYRVVANHLCYIRKVEKVTLTTEKPEKNLYIDMEWVLEYIFDILDEIIKFLPHGVNFYKK